MSTDGPTSPDDPEWVDEIVRRAMERAAEAPPAASPSPPAPPSQEDSSPSEAGPSDPPTVPGADVETAEPPPATAEPVNAPVAELPGSTTGPAPEHGGAATPPPQHEPEHVRSEVPVGAYAGASVAATQVPTDTTFGSPHDEVEPALDESVGLHVAAEPEPDPTNTKLRTFLEWGAVIVGALAVALLIKTFLMQAYFIPSGSMEPTLQVGDRVLVNKLSYTFGDIGRGDIIVFNRPPSQPEGEDDLIKRVVALEGETIEIRDGEIFITTAGSTEQQRLQEPYLAEGIRTTGLVDTTNCVNPTETTCGIPEGHVFVMGDNRPGSRDSRFFGPIDEDLIVGRAFLRVWPLSDFGFL
ncbi:MAG: signal peptidase I [Acidimicrobiales bacterium]